MREVKMAHQREAVILGALLHDIGKFCQRADENPKSQKHTFFGEKWFEENLSEKFEILFGGEKDLIRKAISNHHDYAEFISQADALSAGLDRIEIEKEEEEKDPSSTPLTSIFSEINSSKEKYSYKLKEIEDFNCLFPFPQKEIKLNQNDYKKIFENFNKEIKKIELKDISPFEIIEKFYFLLQKYTWCIPSASYKIEPDVSLFEHLKTTSAIATCLYDFKNQKGEENEEFILLHCDISGIQNFIYSVTTEKALKGLRGRSFYLEILLEEISKLFLEEFSLPICNILFFGGGNFTLLLPNIKNSKEKIEKISREAKEKIFKAHKTKLGLAISYITASTEDLKKENYTNTIEKLSIISSKEKKKKFKEFFKTDFFSPFGGEEKEEKGCEICGEETKEGKCNFCKSFEELANQIKRANYILIKKIKKEDKKIETYSDLLKSLGFEYNFLEKKKDVEGKLYLLNKTNFIEENCLGFKFSSILSPEGTLEDMADNESKGMKKWGALRMDVDNLGKIFNVDLKVKTISRYNMLSQMLSLFFSMGIKEILKEYKKICIVYSGGDDLFILAPWSELPKISFEIYKNFKNFTCNNPEINISGGIYIAPSKKYPVYLAAKGAGEAEDLAKKGEKNKITFLDMPINWEKYKKIEEVAIKLSNLIEEKKVSKSILSILSYGYEEEKLLKEEKVKISKIWRVFYGLKRLMERHKNEAGEIEILRKEFITNFNLKEELITAIKWAEYLTRR